MNFAGAVDHYLVLGLPSGEEGARLTEREITRAYKLKALVLHPDKRPGDPNAHADFLKLLASYETLVNPVSRRQFDESLRWHRQRMEAERLFKQRLEAERQRMQKQRMEKQRMEEARQRMEKQRMEKQRMEEARQRMEKQRMDKQRMEEARQRMEKQRMEAEKKRMEEEARQRMEAKRKYEAFVREAKRRKQEDEEKKKEGFENLLIEKKIEEMVQLIMEPVTKIVRDNLKRRFTDMYSNKQEEAGAPKPPSAKILQVSWVKGFKDYGAEELNYFFRRFGVVHSVIMNEFCLEEYMRSATVVIAAEYNAVNSACTEANKLSNPIRVKKFGCVGPR